MAAIVDACRIRRFDWELKGSSIWAQFQLGWPTWDIRFHELPCRGETIDWEDQIIWIDVRSTSVRVRGPVWAAAHGIAHVFFLDHTAPRFTALQESEADRFADAWSATVRRISDQRQDRVA